MPDKLFTPTTDDQGRRIIRRPEHGTIVTFYLGDDGQGVIERDARGEYIVVNNEKRYWRGDIRPVPEHLRSLPVDDLGMFILKPDAVRRGLVQRLLSLLAPRPLTMLLEHELRLELASVYRLYPYFFTPEWEASLVQYMTSGPCRLYVLRGERPVAHLLEYRSVVRAAYLDRLERPYVNLIHCPDTPEQVRRELILLLGEDRFRGLIRSIS